MICLTCKAQGLKSVVCQGYSLTTMMYSPPFYDEEGRCHVHDPNTTTTEYRCSHGHTWAEHTRGSCWCGWPEKGASR